MIEESLNQLTQAVKENTKIHTEVLFAVQDLLAELKGGQQVKKPVNTEKPVEKKIETPVEEVTQVKQPDEEITISSLVDLIKTLSQSVHGDVRDILSNFGAKKLPDLKKEHYPAFFEAVNNLKNEAA